VARDFLHPAKSCAPSLNCHLTKTKQSAQAAVCVQMHCRPSCRLKFARSTECHGAGAAAAVTVICKSAQERNKRAALGRGLVVSGIVDGGHGNIDADDPEPLSLAGRLIPRANQSTGLYVSAE
jgi:hypothetical protein